VHEALLWLIYAHFSSQRLVLVLAAAALLLQREAVASLIAFSTIGSAAENPQLLDLLRDRTHVLWLYILHRRNSSLGI
jgi:hypothetical protein